MKLYIGTSKKLKGIRGMFAGHDFIKGEEVERSPVILVPMSEYKDHISKTVLEWYYYDWNKDYRAIALGYGSLFNHSHKPNLQYNWSYKNKVIIFKAIRNIKKDEELYIDYQNGSDIPLEKGLTDYKL